MGFGASRAIRCCGSSAVSARSATSQPGPPSRPIESLDASSEAGGGILKFYLHAPCKRDDNRKKTRRNFKISLAAAP